jgi:hypothetical protein
MPGGDRRQVLPLPDGAFEATGHPTLISQKDGAAQR